MDLTLSEEQVLFKTSIREFLEKESSAALVRAAQEDASGYAPALWKKMAELGFMGVPFAEDYGGMDDSFLNLCVLIEELGRFLAPVPFVPTVVYCGLALSRFGNDAQKSKYLTAIAEGRCLMTYAQIESNRPSWDSADIQFPATVDDTGYCLEGDKLFVPYAEQADVILVAARTNGDELKFLLVDPNAAGITCDRLDTIDLEPQYKVTFDEVHVTQDQVLGPTENGPDIVSAIHTWAAAAHCAQMVGAAQRVLEMTTDYAATRSQFGRPIGSFQAIQHHCANMAVDVDGARFMAYEAIWRVSEGLDAVKEVSMAKAWVGDAYERLCALAHQVHGAVGFTMEHDLHLYSRYARSCEQAFGNGDHHRARVAQMLGL